MTAAPSTRPGFLTGRNVLIVDDEPAVCEVLGQGFRLAGARTFTANDGRGALGVMERAPIDVAVVDVLMPDKDGLETMMDIRQRWPGCKVIAVTGGGRVGADIFLQLARHLGADRVFAKPLKIRDLLAAATAALGAP
jgi:DNA-binding response OmpR family regulator